MRSLTLAIGAAVAVAACTVATAATPVPIEVQMQANACMAATERYEAAFQARDHGMPLDQALLASRADPVFQTFIAMIYNHRELRRESFEREEFYRCMSRADY